MPRPWGRPRAEVHASTQGRRAGAHFITKVTFMLTRYDGTPS